MSTPRTLMVTPYAPYRDGIAAYAIQEVRRLRAGGADIEVLSPLPSAAHHHLTLGGVRGILALVKRAAGYDSVILQFSPEMLFGRCRNPAQRVSVWAGLLALAARTRLEIRLHEIEYGPLERNPAERALAARVLLAADRVTVHTGREVDELCRRLPIDPAAITLVDHGAHFSPATTASQSEARVELGLPAGEHVFLAIGFIQEHKGFDRAVEAFGEAALAGSSLHVVGSVRVDHPDLVAYASRLEDLCRATPGATLHRGYVSDEDFDRWIVAADTVVIPYREIWSSGVLERAKLHGVAVIAADVGGIGDQAPPDTLFFTDGETLVKAMRERLAVRAPDPDAPVPGSDERPGPLAWDLDRDDPDRRGVEAQIRARARERQVGQRDGDGPASSALGPLLAVDPLQRPQPRSARPGVGGAKRFLRRAVNWEIEPLAIQLEALRRATLEAVDELDRRCPPGRPGAGEEEG